MQNTHLYFSDHHREDEGVTFDVEIVPSVSFLTEGDRARITVGAYVEGEIAADTLQYDVDLQTGTLKENGVNGLQPEHLIAAAIARITQLNRFFPCKENEEALRLLYQSKGMLDERTIERRKRGVEGKHEV